MRFQTFVFSAWIEECLVHLLHYVVIYVLKYLIEFYDLFCALLFCVLNPLRVDND